MNPNVFRHMNIAQLSNNTALSRLVRILALTLILFTACAEEEVPIPLSEEKMIDVLIDLHMAESMIEKLPLSDRDTVGHVYYRMIYREHGISEAEFDESIAILREDPKRLNALYEQILEKLNVLESTERGVDNME